MLVICITQSGIATLSNRMYNFLVFDLSSLLIVTELEKFNLACRSEIGDLKVRF